MAAAVAGSSSATTARPPAGSSGTRWRCARTTGSPIARASSSIRARRSCGCCGSRGTKTPPALSTATTAVTRSAERSRARTTGLSAPTPSRRRWRATLGPEVELGEGQLLAAGGDGERVRGPARLGLEQAVQRLVGREGHPGTVPDRQLPLARRVDQQVEVAHRRPGGGRGAPQQGLQLLGEARRSGAVGQRGIGGVVAQLEVEAGAGAERRELDLEAFEAGALSADREARLTLPAGGLASEPGRALLEREGERPGGQARLRGHLAPGEILLPGLPLLHRAGDRAHQRRERLAGGDRQAQRQRLGERPEGAGEVGVLAPGHGPSEEQLRALRVAAEERRPGSQEDVFEGGLAAAGQPLEVRGESGGQPPGVAAEGARGRGGLGGGRGEGEGDRRRSERGLAAPVLPPLAPLLRREQLVLPLGDVDVLHRRLARLAATGEGRVEALQLPREIAVGVWIAR